MRGQHILIVDDEEKLVNMMDYLLVKNGYRVSTSLNAHDALIKIKNVHERGESIDLLITDIVMPEMTGFELIDEIQKSGLRMKTMAISGKLKKGGDAELANKGFNGYLSKPFGPMQLVEEIREVMRGKELSRQRSTV